MTGRVLFRTDASLEIGTGHIMRCLTLADGLAGQGSESLFLCREHPGHLADLIVSRGHKVKCLRRPLEPIEMLGAQVPPHAAWLGVPWLKDASESARYIAEYSPSWVVVDHYGLDHRWQDVAVTKSSKILVIDDLADRQHSADLLLDQNLGRQKGDYDHLVPSGCCRLIGPDYALLRPQFAASREQTLERREAAQISHIMISLGGVDRDNVTMRILDMLARLEIKWLERITVVLGASAPWVEPVQARARRMPVSTQVVVGSSDMSSIMSGADLCIGGAGTTSWERCCLGLPTFIVTLADNQQSAATALQEAGAAISLGRPEMDDFELRFSGAFRALVSPDAYRSLARKAAAVCDGEGTSRVLKHMQEQE
ncbi:UDP-2,4-diacetamido-2,4,6-trideoxy-beta-L-altropyranose hydrolase [Qipengyuania gaetbuli]|uniref:UDP-2,4-diacetamido-2,4, 6-trideoxy-beta-L-altropyranose hydrolase n=1 Tax=Qipengyuania gaetbuli TaxID=266952 RepID=UPI001CFDE813|nr:UDP-2,4-diacetamido-2,4,6-trideoxy-beta-L-altropyranose hydrolase [Qipengyuania gaetbuli]